MIREKVSVFDKYTVEIKFEYTPDTNETAFYQVSTYFFVPNILDINKYTYSKNDFYIDLKTKINLQPPQFQLRELSNGYTSPLSRLKRSLLKIQQNQGLSELNKVEYNIKMFCSIFNRSLENATESFLNTNINLEISEKLMQLISDIQTVFGEYRAMSSIFESKPILAKSNIYYNFGDEYISNLFEKSAFEILNILDTRDFKDPSFDAYLKLINSENNYRIEKGYVKFKSEKEKEKTQHRRHILRKYLENSLILELDKKKEGILTEQILFSIAAGLAMIFATGAAFISQRFYGNFSTPVFVILVVSYMFKDRLKDFIRFYFSEKMGRYFNDHKSRILDEENTSIGQLQERFDFLKEALLPEKIIKIRNRGLISQAANDRRGERIFKYDKKIHISPETLKNRGDKYPAIGIEDISRINTIRMVAKSGDSRLPILVFDGRKFGEVKGDHVHYINMIIRIKHSGPSVYKRYVLVVNRKGIKRIEERTISTPI